jgi:hypothetical protein
MLKLLTLLSFGLSSAGPVTLHALENLPTLFRPH